MCRNKKTWFHKNLQRMCSPRNCNISSSFCTPSFDLSWQMSSFDQSSVRKFSCWVRNSLVNKYAWFSLSVSCCTNFNVSDMLLANGNISRPSISQPVNEWSHPAVLLTHWIFQRTSPGDNTPRIILIFALYSVNYYQIWVDFGVELSSHWSEELSAFSKSANAWELEHTTPAKQSSKGLCHQIWAEPQLLGQLESISMRMQVESGHLIDRPERHQSDHNFTVSFEDVFPFYLLPDNPSNYQD